MASILLTSCLAMIPAQPNFRDATGNLASNAQNTLLSLDTDGHLTSMIENCNWGGLQASLGSVLPLTDWFNLTVYDKNMHELNTSPISSGGAINNRIVSIHYVCATQNASYAIYILQLELSQVGST